MKAKKYKFLRFIHWKNFFAKKLRDMIDSQTYFYLFKNAISLYILVYFVISNSFCHWLQILYDHMARKWNQNEKKYVLSNLF